MTPASPNLERIVWGGLFCIVLIIVIAYVNTAGRPRPAHTPPLPVISQVAGFNLTNQLGRAVSLADLRGKVWVADIIFTRCPGPCATMTTRMAELQNELPPDAPVKLITLSADPAHDTPDVLRTFGARYGAKSDRWEFLTGAKEEIVKLTVGSLKLVSQAKDPASQQSPNDLFLHSGYFVIVDKQGRVRATFDSLDPLLTPEEVDSGVSKHGHLWLAETRPAILRAIKQLLREP